MGIEIPMSGNHGSAEHRKARRYQYRGDATARQLESGLTQPGRILDLSARGCLLTLPDLSGLEVDTLVDMSVNTSSVAFRALGQVRHRSPSCWRVGIAFVNLSRRGQADLLQLIDDLEAAEQQGRPTTHEVTVFRHVERPRNPPQPPRP